MALLLFESSPSQPTPDGVRTLLDRIRAALGPSSGADGDVVEAQVTADRQRVFVILDVATATPTDVDAALAAAGLTGTPVAPVRLVGADLAEVKAGAARAGGGYLVEWDLPAGLTMDAYLTRKREKAPLYAKVPEATFLRTYVREDMVKCLCFYDADDEGAVLKARDTVSAPIDRLHHLDPAGR